MNGENAQRMQQGARERDDINFQRSQEAAYQRQNWQHETMTFEAEQRQARAEGRYPMFASPAQVPDMPRGNEGQQLPVSPFAGILGAGVIVAGLVFVLIAALIWSVFALLAPIVGVAIRVIVLLLIVGAAGLTVAWLIMRLTAKDDPAKLHRAKLFNPVRVAKVLVLFVGDWYKERKGRRASKKAV
ncbi:hypothetical protein ACLH0K_08890 [Arthrobacter sp. MPF02]|uniref:hypothetical protein n=1 Tax=Arthrobacter sp. MPF02 TaxID=3388492 RepID=UPI003984E0C3